MNTPPPSNDNSSLPGQPQTHWLDSKLKRLLLMMATLAGAIVITLSVQLMGEATLHWYFFLAVFFFPFGVLHGVRLFLGWFGSTLLETNLIEVSLVIACLYPIATGLGIFAPRRSIFLGWYSFLIGLLLFNVGSWAYEGLYDPIPSYTPGNTVNLTQAGRLSQTTSIEIISLLPQRQPRAIITDPAAINKFVQLLDQELPIHAPTACTSDFEILFHLEDGTVTRFGYTCSGHSLKGMGEVYVPFGFEALFDQQLKLASQPTSPSVTVMPSAAPALTPTP